MSEVKTRSSITLKGSSKLIQEFFNYGINSILFQRGIVKRYGMNLLVTNDNKLLDFLKPLLDQIEGLLTQKRLKRLVLVIINVATKEVLERWQFDVEADDSIDENAPVDACEKRIKQEISDVLRQITAAVSFLPLLEEECAFDVLMYTTKSAKLSNDWADSTACNIVDPEEVQLRSFSTKVHKVHTKVQYKADL
ncbi:DNA-binding HORMA domain containing protein [Aphelenchoides bicaudatus]|nr:DNA-binding HORMA domain containing protein [Aphelenchoides bicaudatus]